jgi:hypothetical protein
MKHLLTFISIIALAGIVAGCATSPARRTEKLLTKSGFAAVKATTATQQQQVHALPPDKVSLVKRKGKTYYVYPDAARNLLYVGNQAQYQAYQIAVQDQALSEDAKLIRDFQAAPVLNADAAVMSGAEPSGEQIWEGWPD